MNIRATAKHFSFLASCVTGYDVQVIITEDPSYVGYTSMPSYNKAKIVLSCRTDLYQGLSEARILVFMLGVLAHECLHLCYTDFEACDTKTIVIPRKAEKQAFHEICNIVEDMAIEFFAPQKIGGKMLKGLSAVIQHTWQTSPNIDEGIPEDQADVYAYTQVLRAMIQVGDRGMVKGKFLSDIARDAFIKILPIMNEAVVEPDGEARIDYCLQIYRILLPLLKNEQENAKQDMDAGKCMSLPEGMGSGQEAPEQEDSDEDEGSGQNTAGEIKKKLREQLAKQLTAQLTEQADDKAGQQGGEDEESDEGDETQIASKSISIGTIPPDERPYEASTKDENDLTAIDEDMEFTDDEIESLLNDINQVEVEMQIADAAEQILIAKAQEDLMLDSQDVLNEKANNPNESRYNDIVQRYAPKIGTLTSELRKIFMNDRSKTKISNHGSRISVKRLVDGKLHTNIMLQRSNPKELDDMAVYILIDKSGSMARNNGRGKRNDQCAAETAICLYEALRALRVPVYITGFTTRGSKALHMHYVTWNSPQSDRYTLANFAADDCNYDYYSIMEATRILKKRNAKHKLLIVISDGAPCNVMRGGSRMDPINATAAAVTEARKTTDVLGVALNCFDEAAYTAMYGKDYITVSTANDMFLPISETIQRIVKSW